jgi:hypothetical protein
LDRDMAFAVVIIVCFLVTATMIAVKIITAALAAGRFERVAIKMVESGLCPCCGKGLPGPIRTNCVHCGNWIEEYLRHRMDRREGR